MSNQQQNNAKQAKDDEYYTTAEVVAAECSKYNWRDKIVYCNCDNKWSEFYQYFKNNYEELKLKGLISTHFVENTLFDPNNIPYKTTYDGETEYSSPLQEDGSFSSLECRKIMAGADVIVTNPPFSEFRNFVDLMISEGKDFLILGAYTNISYLNIFKYFWDNKIWFGQDGAGKCGHTFNRPNGEQTKLGFTCWFTNIPYAIKNDYLTLTENYHPDLYPTYDNFAAIEVERLKYIPKDYEGLMGVPSTFFLHKLSNQFELIGMDRYLLKNGDRFYLKEERLNARFIIRNKQFDPVPLSPSVKIWLESRGKT